MAESEPFWPDEEEEEEEDDPFRAPVPFAPEPELDLAPEFAPEFAPEPMLAPAPEFAPVLVPVPAPVRALPVDAALPFAVESSAGTPLAPVLALEGERPSDPDRVLDP